MAAALRTPADALDQEQATSTVTYTATVEPQARGPAPGGLTASLADRFVAQLTPAAVEVLVVLCRHAPEVTYEAFQADIQAHLGISRARLGGVLTSLAGARQRLSRDVDYPSERDKDLRRCRIEPVLPSSCWVRLSALARLDWLPGGARRGLTCRPDRRGTSGRLQDHAGVDLDA